MPEKDVKPYGYAVIKDFKLVGYIEIPLARGYNFLVNKVRSSPISIQDSEGNNIGLEVIRSKTNLKARFDGDDLTRITLDTYFKTGLMEQQTRENLFTKKKIKELSKKQSMQIKDEMEKVVKKSKELKTDCINLGEKIRTKYPLRWEKIKDKWDEVYPEIEIEIKVRSNIARSYTVSEPNGYREKG